MNTIVCMKRVPDSATRVRVTPDGAGLDPAGVKYVVNPYDEFALEDAIVRPESGSLCSVRTHYLQGESQAALSC